MLELLIQQAVNKSLLFIYRQQRQTSSGVTSRNDVECTGAHRRHRRRNVNRALLVSGRDAPTAHNHRRRLTDVTADGEKHSVTRTADTRLSGVEPSMSFRGEAASDPTAPTPAIRPEQTTCAGLGDWFSRAAAAAAEYEDSVMMTTVTCRRRRLRHHVDRSSAVLYHHVSTAVTARRRQRAAVSRRSAAARRRCSVPVRRRPSARYVTSGDDVTMTSAADSESRSPRPDRAFLGDHRNDDDDEVCGDDAKWQPDLSVIAAAVATTDTLRTGRAAADGSCAVSQSHNLPCIRSRSQSPLRIQTVCATARPTVALDKRIF